MLVDLHLHTLHSDGKLKVKETIDLAAKNNIGMISITDHDTLKGIGEAMDHSKVKGITCISGIELSCRNENDHLKFPKDVSIHILGYNIDYSSKELLDYLDNYHYKRKKILDELILDLVNNDLDISYDDINVIAGKQMRIQDVINHINSCFMCNTKKNRYISIANKYYERLFFEDCTLHTALNLIKKAGGIAVLAHAFFSYRDYEVKINSNAMVLNLLNYLDELGINGIEAFYPKFTYEQSLFLQEEAIKRNLIVTSGSDFHGTPLRKGMMNQKIKEMETTSKFLLDINRYK